MKNDGILDLLPRSQQNAIILQALTHNVRGLVSKRSTLGAFVDAVTKNAHWGKLRTITLSDVFVNVPVPAAAVTRKTAFDPGLFDIVTSTVKKTPGLRAEQIYMAMPSVDRHLVKSTLAKLRANGTVKTKGNKRATTYTVA